MSQLQEKIKALAREYAPAQIAGVELSRIRNSCLC